MYRIAFAAALILLLWLQSFCTTTTHRVVGDRHVFAYGWVAWAFFAALIVLLLAFSGIAWRYMKDRVTAGILLAGIPLFCFAVVPQMCCERVEISDDRWIHRREPPHTEYNVDIALDEIARVTEIKRESGSFSTYYAVGYRVTTRDGRQYELPSNTVLTAAQETIDTVLAARKIPIAAQVIPRPPPK